MPPDTAAKIQSRRTLTKAAAVDICRRGIALTHKPLGESNKLFSWLEEVVVPA